MIEGKLKLTEAGEVGSPHPLLTSPSLPPSLPSSLACGHLWVFIRYNLHYAG